MAKKIHTMSSEKWDSLKTIPFRNVCKDFSIKTKLLKVTPSGSLKVADAVSIGGGMPVRYEVWYAKREGDKYWIRQGGSPCNSYVYEGE